MAWRLHKYPCIRQRNDLPVRYLDFLFSGRMNEKIRCRQMCFLTFRMEAAAMKNTCTCVRNSRAGIKSILLTICMAAAMAACDKTTDNPMPPQNPPTPKASSNAPNAGNTYPGLYDASNVAGAVFKYTSSSKPQYQNAQGKPVRRRVIHT